MAIFADCLQEMLLCKALEFPDEDGVLILKENKSRQRAKLIGAPRDLVAVDIRKLTKIAQARGFKPGGWEKGKGWGQSCDYLLVFQENGNHRALLIDLKKTLGNTGRSKGMSQLRWSRALLDYLRSVCEILRAAEPSSLEIAVDYALISKQPHDKLNMRPVHTMPGATSRERHMNIDICIAFRETLYWKGLLRNQDPRAKRGNENARGNA